MAKKTGLQNRGSSPAFSGGRAGSGRFVHFWRTKNPDTNADLVNYDFGDFFGGWNWHFGPTDLTKHASRAIIRTNPLYFSILNE